MTQRAPSGADGAALGGAQTIPEANRAGRELAATVKHRTELANHSLAALEQACRDLRDRGATDWATIRVRTTLTVSPDGGLARAVTAHWDNDDAAYQVASPDAAPLNRGPANGPVDK